MSFLDNLENNLKALESREENDPTRAGREAAAREKSRVEALARAPFAEALKTSPFTDQLLTACRVVGHAQRTLVQFTWLGEVLRLDAKEKRLELRPTIKCVEAVYFVDGEVQKRAPLNLKGNAEKLAKSWLTE